MKYTLKSFFKLLCGDISHIEYDFQSDVFARWDGSTLEFLDKENNVIDRLYFCKHCKNEYHLDLSSLNYWFFTIKFSDGGLWKGKKYNVSKIIKK